MKIVIFGDQRRVGAVSGEQVIDLNRASASIPADLRRFIEAGQPALDAAQRAIDTAGSAPDGAVRQLADVQLLAPWPERRIACVGGNYAAHLMGMEAGRPGEEGEVTLESITRKARATGQWGFWKVAAEVPGPNADIAYPARTEYFDYEGEAAIVIGKRGKNIAGDRLEEYVWGISLVNDWSIRDGMGGNARPMSYNLAKNFDGSTSMGPCIVVGELTPQNVDVQLSLNGEVRQHFNTREMIWGFGEVLEYLSRDFTFVPGDIIAGGTNAGTASDTTKRGPDGSRPKDRFLKVGDVVELSSPAIGALRNQIVAP